MKGRGPVKKRNTDAPNKSILNALQKKIQEGQKEKQYWNLIKDSLDESPDKANQLVMDMILKKEDKAFLAELAN
ncbi:hypothetical protein TVAG_258540 [Trichomonas vaginalis G3]|uniref:Uncharacterized protein n=1 Tax=Trichomonas vaginalis (strain ATCC PRA-98 / G3) TaxID=412133 RepID=A2E958_TRIV3|nr:hypothetical protein TVAGG3_0542560 [Trichomonas vaginalis G3]EAY10852.1 hypothetical protein TVAG_258540 [Trichomonas vaginalis G3]KAI5519940.1 hypothetical protein TVAGG3_0542560 [Trichomonas vaginalis G3]|eukprot:XP_001323075.1 hypothetical protein [Trichomonas vaginalis G3]